MSKNIKMLSLVVMLAAGLLLTPLSFAAAESNAGVGTTLVETFVSEALSNDLKEGNDELTYKVYLPAGYDAERSHGYPVLYLLHGSSGTENSWDRYWAKLDEMIGSGVIEPLIAVVPASGNSYWVDSAVFGAYESAVIRDLIPRIDEHYNTIADRENRYIAGYSMGGYGALRYALVYPELFKGTILLSPALQKDEAPATSGAVTRGAFGMPFDESIWDAYNYPAALEDYVKQPHRVSVYIMAGDDDWNHLSEKEDLPSDAAKYNMEVQAVHLYQALHRVNLFNEPFEKWEDVPANPAELRIINGGHSSSVWLQGFEEGLKYMFGVEESESFSPKYNEADYQATQKGSVSLHRLQAPAFGDKEGTNEMAYQVYLPYGYDDSGTVHYPVLYLLHGSWGDEKSWNKFWPILDTMIEEKTIEPVIAVAPITGNSYWVDSERYGAVETTVIRELIPTIDETYMTIASREGRGLVGFSMGGYGALRYALVYPDLFGGATLLSPAVQRDEAPSTSGAVNRGSFGEPFDPKRWDELNYPAALQSYGQQEHEVPVFIITGDDDWNHMSEKEDLPEDAYKYNMEVQAVMLYQELHRSNVFNRPFDKWEDVPGSPAELRIVNGGHDMEVWATGFEQGVTYMFANGLSGPVKDPSLPVTRGEFTAWLMNALEMDVLADGDDIAFVDIAETEHADAVRAAVQAGIVKGFTDSTFRPNDAVTREQMAVMLLRGVMAAGFFLDDGGSRLDAYLDGAQVSDWALHAVNTMLNAGIITAKDSTTIAPKAAVTRGEATASLDRLTSWLSAPSAE